MMQPVEALGPLVLSKPLILTVVGIILLLFVRKLHWTLKLRGLERLHGCEKLRSEKGRFRYDFLGITKALELAFHFKRRTSLPYTNTLFKRYGETYASNVLGFRLIFTCSADNIKHLLSTAFPDFDSSPLRKPLFEPITPHGIFTLDGAGWKQSRDQLRGRLCNLRKIIDLNQCERHFQAFLQHVPPNGQAFDAQACVFALALDMQTLFSLGESVDALSHSQSKEKRQFLDDLLFVKERIVQDGFRGPLQYLYPKRRFLQCCKRARKYVMAHVARQLEEQHTMNEKPERDPHRRNCNSKEGEVSLLADQALSILLANDSMSTTLSGLFFCLARDERVVHKLRASILDTVGLTPPTWGQLGSLHYIRWVLQEVMRLFPAVVFNARVANKDSTLPTGGGTHGNSPVLLRKGEIVVFSTWARHRLGKDFGENPEEFYPERWEHLSADMIGFIPFNKGPRACPGQHYAMIVLTYIVTRIFQTFSTVHNYNSQEWTERISMTLENENGVLIGLS
ncbi:putative cytochrome P450 oxidoreductase/alkane hydroxylase [Aspergillus nomiae NRRL 13137]|uniref:Putative cytochrome P450 oxidoreductase/alkane hydroxylase n=1 Tax=Aspergillus nomiae NRRL (strain ATCC 15546 / NRRL 13137 / CBS 260.88 / M93) TaxID=1509407 RepID=A0A0L1IUR0_ASPN3|nr:putative cytochrome P450 oxidoreductase/alkane hydroxylase [Aspergillus nomiae NRRL 13137]KNG83301.1 putative cytochrome P450 oxidoreductase/alkane hydroxylase [Aspergillus nomiae NRRL 13137]